MVGATQFPYARRPRSVVAGLRAASKLRSIGGRFFSWILYFCATGTDFAGIAETLFENFFLVELRLRGSFLDVRVTPCDGITAALRARARTKQRV
jgi:hypothetical protein